MPTRLGIWTLLYPCDLESTKLLVETFTTQREPDWLRERIGGVIEKIDEGLGGKFSRSSMYVEGGVKDEDREEIREGSF